MAESNSPKPETAQQSGQKLLEFVDKTEFGTDQFIAVNDYLELRALYAMREFDIVALTGDPDDRTKKEGNIRIQEIKIALLEHRIAQNKSRLVGYSKSYQHMETAFDNIYSLAMVEASQKFANVSEQEDHAIQMQQVAFEGAHEIISMKKDAS